MAGWGALFTSAIAWVVAIQTHRRGEKQDETTLTILLMLGWVPIILAGVSAHWLIWWVYWYHEFGAPPPLSFYFN